MRPMLNCVTASLAPLRCNASLPARYHTFCVSSSVSSVRTRSSANQASLIRSARQSLPGSGWLSACSCGPCLGTAVLKHYKAAATGTGAASVKPERPRATSHFWIMLQLGLTFINGALVAGLLQAGLVQATTSGVAPAGAVHFIPNMAVQALWCYLAIFVHVCVRPQVTAMVSSSSSSRDSSHSESGSSHLAGSSASNGGSTAGSSSSTGHVVTSTTDSNISHNKGRIPRQIKAEEIAASTRALIKLIIGPVVLFILAIPLRRVQPNALPASAAVVHNFAKYLVLACVLICWREALIMTAVDGASSERLEPYEARASICMACHLFLVALVFWPYERYTQPWSRQLADLFRNLMLYPIMEFTLCDRLDVGDLIFK